MTDINKQKFLAELAQLLTFMYEEDRQTALQVYAGMFEEAEDEQSLLQSLVSPIRQAVLVARAYNATERKLSVHSQSREDAPVVEGQPAFLAKIYEIRAEALSTQPEKAVEDENQFSLFDEASGAIAPSIVIPDEEFVEVQVAEEPEAPAEPAAPEAEAEAPAAEESAEPAPEVEAEAAEAEPEEAAGEPAETEAEPEAEKAADEVDAFMADFSLPAEAEAKQTPAEPAAEPAPAAEAVEEAASRFTDPKIVRKPRILILIPFILFAVPLTLIGILLLLIPTALCLGLAAGFLTAGVVAVTAAFSGFAVLADLFVILGAALLLLAFGLLFLWLFVWFIGGAIVGLVRGVIELGREWCFKEVPVL